MEAHLKQDVFQPSPAARQRAHIQSFAQYQQMYTRSLHDSDAFWREQAALLDWFTPFTAVQSGSLQDGTVSWFLNGKLNASYNCIDRHVAAGHGEKVAILFEADTPGQVQKITFRQLQADVSRCANALRTLGVRRGDAVCIYLPMVPAAAVAMLACARIGAPHRYVSTAVIDSARARCSATNLLLACACFASPCFPVWCSLDSAPKRSVTASQMVTAPWC